MARKQLHILFLPGLGATRRMYDKLAAGIQARLGRTKFSAYHLAFPEPAAGETMDSFAGRMLDGADFRRRRFDFIVGTSFGGMLLQELIAAERVSTDRLVLISTAFTGRDIARIPTLLARLAGVVPRGLHAWLRDRMVAIYPLLRIRRQNARELAGMIKEMPPGLLFRAAPMILRWRRPLRDGVRRIGAGWQAGRTLFVMGGRDPLIRYDRVRTYREPDLFFPEGDHFIALTRCDQVATRMIEML